MDQIDRQILADLQIDGRQTITDLARSVHLSVSGCQRRLRDLEERKIIRGYHADVDAHQLGYTFQILVFITLGRENRATIEAFDAALDLVPGLTDAERLFGDPDYLLRIATIDQQRYQQLYDSHLTALPGVERLTSTIVMKHVVDAKPLPLP